MKHYLFTRFNLRTEQWTVSKNAHPVLTDEWHRHRFDLFAKYCLPSVANQRNRNFVWCVFFDGQITPPAYRPLIAEWENQYPLFKPFFVDGMAAYLPAAQHFIRRTLEPADEFIITTRLDNDDMLHRDFIQTVQDLFRPIHGAAIDIRKGFQVTFGGQYPQIRRYRSYLNPFISLIERADDFETVLAKPHEAWRKAPLIIVENKTRLTVQLVHEHNIWSDTNFDWPRVLKLLNAEFGTEPQNEIRDRWFNYIVGSLCYPYYFCVRQARLLVYKRREINRFRMGKL